MSGGWPHLFPCLVVHQGQELRPRIYGGHRIHGGPLGLAPPPRPRRPGQGGFFHGPCLSAGPRGRPLRRSAGPRRAASSVHEVIVVLIGVPFGTSGLVAVFGGAIVAIATTGFSAAAFAAIDAVVEDAAAAAAGAAASATAAVAGTGISGHIRRLSVQSCLWFHSNVDGPGVL